MDVIRSGSPDFANQLTVGKNTPMRQYQADKEYEDEDFLTSSLPLPSTEKDGCSVSPLDNRSLSTSILKCHRPRSASLQYNRNQIGSPNPLGKKSALKNLSRPRPSSAKFGNGRNRSSSLSLVQEANAGTYKIETAFAKIKAQLAQLSVEDVVLQERIHRLTAEIALIQRYAARLHYHQDCSDNVASEETRQQNSTDLKNPITPMNTPTLLVTNSLTDFMPLSERTWEGGIEEVMEEEEGKSNTSHPINFLETSSGKYSLGSCGSLADSEGSLSPKRPTCNGMPVAREKALESNNFNTCEDDVFFS